MNFVIAIVSLILLEVSFYVRAQSQSLAPEGDGRFYSTRYDNLDVETFFKSSRLLSNYIDCLLDKKSCPPEGKDLKRILPEALRTSCEQCTQVQKTKVLEIIKRLYFQYPDKYIALAERYDPTGRYTKNFEKWFEQNSNFINDSEVTISNILTTRRRPVTKTTTATTSPRPTFKLKTTTSPPRSSTTPTTTTTKAAPATRRPLSTRQTTATTTLSPFSFFVTFPSSLPSTSTTLRPQSQTFTNSFSVPTNSPSSPRPNLLLTTIQPPTQRRTSTTTILPTTTYSTTQKTTPTTTSRSTTIEESTTEKRIWIQNFPLETSTTTQTALPSTRQTTQRTTINRDFITSRVPTTESTSTAFVRNFDRTPNPFVTIRVEQNPQEGFDVIDNFFVPGG